MDINVFRTYIIYSFLFIVALGSAGIVGYEILTGQTPNTLVTSFLTAIIGFSINSQGVSHGVSATNFTIAANGNGNGGTH